MQSFLFSLLLAAQALVCFGFGAAARGDVTSRHDQHVLGVLSDPEPDPSHHQGSLLASGFVALGDSYSAGIGTGIDGHGLTSEGPCRRGQHAYPLLIQADLNKATWSNTSLQWLSCTGAKTTDLISSSSPLSPVRAADVSQVDAVNSSLPLDFATLSIGGNDLGFFDVMNACIFRFYSFYSGTCEAALAAADTALRSDVFERRLDIILHEILDKVAWERHPSFVVTVTGYARFFNADTPECDDMSLGVWWGGPKLKREIRAKMNALVDATNDILRRTVLRVNRRFRARRPKVLFVDYDAHFEGHRFCEPGVVEPAYDRTESWFFLVGGPDNAENRTHWPNGTNGDPESLQEGSQGGSRAMALLPSSSPLVDPNTCLEHAQQTGDWGELALCYMVIARQRDPSLRPARRGLIHEKNNWWVPTYYGKTFHPRSLGCEAIRDQVYALWKKNGMFAGRAFASNHVRR